jgi:hypothetical protein
VRAAIVPARAAAEVVRLPLGGADLMMAVVIACQ